MSVGGRGKGQEGAGTDPLSEADLTRQRGLSPGAQRVQGVGRLLLRSGHHGANDQLAWQSAKALKVP